MKRKIRGNAGVGLSFMLILIVLLILQLVTPKNEYSTVEKRELSTLPTISINEYLNGNYQENYNLYTNDQFPARKALGETKTDIDILFGSRKQQDVFILPNMLAQEFTGCKENQMAEKVNAINTFVAKYPNINSSFILVPNKIGVYKEQFPLVDNVLDQKKYIDQFYYQLTSNVTTLDAYSILKAHKQEDLYYKSDHHWTAWATKYIFDSWLTQMEIDKKNVQYDNYILTENFVGSLANQINYTKFEDRFDILIPKDNTINYVVDYGDKQTTSVYDSKASQEDPYMVYFGGNHPIFTIDTNSNTNKKIIIFKDSYANSFIPLLIPYYSQITVVDSRYYYDNIEEVMKNNDFTDMLFLYNVNTYFKDSSLEEMLKNTDLEE